MDLHGLQGIEVLCKAECHIVYVYQKLAFLSCFVPSIIQKKYSWLSFFFPDSVPFLFLHVLAAKEDSAGLVFPNLIWS